MLPASGKFALQSRGFKTGGITFVIGGGGFFPLLPAVLPFGEALEPAFPAALAPGTESEMMINYEKASIKSVNFVFMLLAL